MRICLPDDKNVIRIRLRVRAPRRTTNVETIKWNSFKGLKIELLARVCRNVIALETSVAWTATSTSAAPVDLVESLRKRTQ